jgi:hypothetical protein
MAGKYWTKFCSPLPHLDCGCADTNGGKDCWWRKMANLRQKIWMPKLNIWNPAELDKIKVTGKSEIWAMQWAGDIAFLDYIPNIGIAGECILEIFNRIKIANRLRIQRNLTPHKFLILTKWPDRLRKVINNPHAFIFPDNNIYIGISASDQKTFDQRIKGLLKLEGFNKWVSLEPLKGPINMFYLGPNVLLGNYNIKRIDQVIVGGLTNAKYYYDLDWYRSIRDQCEAANVPFYIKRISGGNRELDGKEHNDLIWRTK